MSIFKLNIFACFFVILFCEFYIAYPQDQKKTEPPPNITVENPEDDVIKVNTNLIQTGVTVFDKKGQFVDKLNQEDFDLRVDGKPVSVSFFEKFLAGGNNQPAAPEKKNPEKTNVVNNVSPGSNMLGRTVIFVVDDLHLAFDSQKRTRDLINKFIDREMLSNDIVAVVSTTGKVGFLQQYTSDKIVLHKAVERLVNNRNTSGADRMQPPMSEYEALMINRYDTEITDIFAHLLANEEPGANIEILREQVRSRARTILSITAIINKGTYATLEQTIRNSSQIAGRKVVFFISDGFLLDPSNTDSSYRMRRITDAATRSNTVIYSFDAKGLEAGFPEGTTANGANGTGYRVQSGERSEVQDGLSELADSTGGKFIHNTNDLQSGITRSINEVSSYYLLAWEPDSEIDKSDKLKRIEVSVKNHPELQVRMQTGYLNTDSKPENKQNQNRNKPEKTDKVSDKVDKNPESIVNAELDSAIVKPFPLRDLPISVVANYLDEAAEGPLLTTAVQIKNDISEFTPDSESSSAKINLLGVVYNSDGKREGDFNQLLTVNATAAGLKKNDLPPLFYNYQLKLKPGLYQVRVVARGAKTARVGTALQWILIPDLTSKKIALSSLFLGEISNDGKQNKTDNSKQGNTENGVVSEIFDNGINVDRQFAHSSTLRYLVFIYNAAPGGKLPEVFLQTRILRGNAVVMTSVMKQVPIAKGQDLTGIPYATDIPLSTLPVGRYELQVTVQDHGSNSTAEQSVKFEVK